MTPQARSELRTTFKSQRMQLAHRLIDSARLVDRFAEQIEREKDQLDEFVERELVCLIDYLAESIGKGNEKFRDLYIGERIKMAYVENDTTEMRNKRIAELLESDRQILVSALKGKVSTEAVEGLDAFFKSLTKLFTTEFHGELYVLLVGDCLYLDVMAFLSGQAAKHGIAVRPHFVTSHIMAEVKSEVAALKGQPFDLVFFSPFTYMMHPEFDKYLAPSNAFKPSTKRYENLFPMLRDVEDVIDVFATEYDCPVFVHNTAAVIRDEPLRRFAKNLVTRGMRAQVRSFVDAWLTSYLDKKNTESFQHLYRFDETKLLEHTSDMELGSVYYHHPIQHPAAMGKAVANEYAKICNVAAYYLRKKMVVCDLDNTLWDGVIGEGAVTHYRDRQETLKRLKAKGVLLAINSKNDPANVHWTDGVLSESDFVYSNINWDPKPNAFPKMEADLNLKRKDFVFVDDRADERELVSSIYPEVRTMDATDPVVWECFAIWEMMIDGEDRTQMYQEREQRNSFVQEKSAEDKAADKAAMFKELQLQLTIKDAGSRELKRVTELVNRTNQFNMQGSRTTFSEVSQRHRDDSWHILQGHMTDRFGDMGVICVLMAHETDIAIEIPIFVLSCRVFGYGVETAMLNHIKRLAAAGGKQVVGRYQSTPQNMPCKNVYSQNGFEKQGDVWVFTGREALPDPEWLSVKPGNVTSMPQQLEHAS